MTFSKHPSTISLTNGWTPVRADIAQMVTCELRKPVQHIGICLVSVNVNDVS